METPTIAEASARIARRELSPIELVEHCLTRIGALDGQLHSFVTVTAERALSDARSAEKRMMNGTLLSNLDGIPIAHKDVYATQGVRTTAQSRLLEHWVPTEDAEVVSQLAAAGTSMMGKLATHEFALGGPPFDLPWPPARNPWNTGHYASGSSSGTAVAVAAGLICGGTGTDTAGSIRAPAALCGVVGLKPTYGLCSRKGIVPLAFTLDHAGPIASTVEDCALLLQGMVKTQYAGFANSRMPVSDFTAGLRQTLEGIRIGVVSQWHEHDHRVSPAVRRGIETSLSAWRDRGAEIVEIALPSLFEFQAASFVITVCEAYAIHEAEMRTRIDEYGELLRDRLALGALMGSADYVQALRRRRELCADMRKAAAGIDVLVTAGAPSEAPSIDNVPKWGDLTHPGFYHPFNLTGWPAMTLRSGFGEKALPVSVQIAAKPYQEALLFQVGNALEQARARESRCVALPISA